MRETGGAGAGGCECEAAQGLPGGFQAAARKRQSESGVLAFQATGEGSDSGCGHAQAAVHGGFEAMAEIVQALVTAADEGLQLGVDLRDGDAGKALAAEDDLVADSAVGAGFERGDPLLDAVLGSGNEFGGGGGGGRAQIGDEVGYGEVGLVADRRDDGELRRGNGAGEGFVVEAGEVFDGAAAAGDEDEVGLLGMLIEEADAGGDGAGAFGALHEGGVDQQVEAGVAAADDFDDVVENSAGGRGDDADAAGEGWELALPGGVEEALGFELVAELLVGKLQSAGAAGLDGFCDQLQLAARLVDRDAAANEDSQSVLRTKAEKLGLAAEEDDGKLRIAVLEREVDVAGGGWAAVGDLARDPEVGVGLLNMLPHVGDQVADRPDAAFRKDCRGRWGDSGDRLWGYGRSGEEQAELAFLGRRYGRGRVGDSGGAGASGPCALEGKVGECLGVFGGLGHTRLESTSGTLFESLNMIEAMEVSLDEVERMSILGKRDRRRTSLPLLPFGLIFRRLADMEVQFTPDVQAKLDRMAQMSVAAATSSCKMRSSVFSTNLPSRTRCLSAATATSRPDVCRRLTAKRHTAG